jgi:uncharacterized protein YcnI
MKRLVGLTALSVVTVLAVSASPAFAHVDPDPLAVQVGTTATIAFGLEHGCNGSPTTAMELTIPTGVTNVKPVDKAGWTSAVNGDKVTFTGGKIDATTKDHFDITLTAPTTPGDVHFLVLQTCEKGVNRWIEIGEEGKPEPEFPAATLKVTAGVPTAADLTPPDDATPAKTSSHTGAVVAGIVGAVVVLGGGAAVLLRRRGRKAAPAA